MTETAEAEEPVYYGHVIIEWPAPLKPGEIRPIPGFRCSILDAETGKPVTTVENLFIPAVTAAPQAFITCELTMFADDKGMPVLFAREDGSVPVRRLDGKIRTGTFPFLVAEMRVRADSQAKSR